MGGMTLHSCSSHWDTSVTLQELALRGPLSGLATYHLIVKCVPMQRSGARTANSPRGLRLKHQRPRALTSARSAPVLGPTCFLSSPGAPGRARARKEARGPPSGKGHEDKGPLPGESLGLSSASHATPLAASSRPRSQRQNPLLGSGPPSFLGFPGGPGQAGQQGSLGSCISLAVLTATARPGAPAELPC